MAETDTQPDTLSIVLRRPVQLGTETYATLELREPTGGEWLQFEKVAGVEGNMLAISLISGVPLPAVKMIGTRDLVTATKFLDRFF